MTERKRPIIEFLRSNTFINIVFYGAVVFFQNLSPEWLAGHSWFRQWVPPIVAVGSMAIYKINQMRMEKTP